MRTATCLAILTMILLARAAPSQSVEEREIRKTEREWLNSYVSRDAAAMDRIEADEFRIVYPDGRVVTKAEELEGVRKAAGPPASIKLETENETVRIYGVAALVTGNFIQKGRYQAGARNGQDFRIVERYTDVYVKRDGRWQVVASQLTTAPAEAPK